MQELPQERLGLAVSSAASCEWMFEETRLVKVRLFCRMKTIFFIVKTCSLKNCEWIFEETRLVKGSLFYIIKTILFKIKTLYILSNKWIF
jgi:hypothetical protein